MEDSFNKQEFLEPIPMKTYWVLLPERSQHIKRRPFCYNTIVLILDVTENNIRLVPLKRGKLTPGQPEMFAKGELKITGLATDVCDFDYNEFLTSEHSIIRKYALKHLKR